MIDHVSIVGNSSDIYTILNEYIFKLETYFKKV